ncbi:MAG: hypothetical protein IJ297_02520 [Clostridia bacterium]|nr:hypothetical protein [Clostridia bacterium]
MNWSKIKNIMIMILVLINLFLIVNIGISSYMSSALPKGTGESFVNLLEKKGIVIEKNLVPKTYETRRIVTAEAYDIDYLTELFIGKKVSYVSEGQSLVAPGDDKKLVLTGERIEFTTLKEAVDKNGSDIMRALKDMGFSKDGAYYDQNDGYVKLKIGMAPLEGLYLDVLLDKNGEIASLKGVWPKIKITGSDDKVSVISIVNSIIDTVPAGSRIVDIEEIYVFNYSEDGYKVKNAWRIYNQGRGYVCY